MHSPKPYPDLWLRLTGSLVFSHLVETLGREASLAEQWVSSAYWIALFSGSLIAFLVWTLIAVITTRLDKHYDWLVQPVQRLGLQIMMGVIIPGVLLLLLTWIQVKLLWDQSIIDNGFHLTEFPLIMLILVLVNGLYFTWYLYNRLREAEAQQPTVVKETSPSETYSNILVVNSGIMQVPVPVNTIQYITRQGDYTLIKTPDKEYIESTSLDDLEGALDPSRFFRANRQVIISFSSCKGFRSLEYGKLEVQTDPPLSEPLIVSQKKARPFRDWMSKR
ncbi:MAG: LytTR family transcriptional regulator [Cyclobacteriaceae bacterium]|jgi:hypothetical protein|nr:LytTR family transcriptional regulator [Cyclobacteriaceae bacterium]